jgi:hypothetical protein
MSAASLAAAVILHHVGIDRVRAPDWSNNPAQLQAPAREGLIMVS